MQQLEKINMTTGAKTSITLSGTLYGRANAVTYLSGNFYIHDNGANTLHSVTPAGVVSLVGSTSSDFLNLSAVGSSLYALDGDGQAIEINPATGADVSTVAIDPVPNNARYQSIARDPTTGILYGVGPTDFPSSSESQLFQFDPLTGKVSNEVELTISNLRELAFDASGVLYGCANIATTPEPDELLKGSIATINISTGDVTPTGWATSTSVSGISEHCFAYNSNDGLIYQTWGESGDLFLRSIDPVTGSITEIGAISNIPSSFFPQAMTYDSEQDLFYLGGSTRLYSATPGAVGNLVRQASGQVFSINGLALIPDLKITGFTVGADATISFESVLNREYGLYSSINLVDWNPVAGFECITASPPINTETGVPLPATEKGFFRLGAPISK